MDENEKRAIVAATAVTRGALDRADCVLRGLDEARILKDFQGELDAWGTSHG